MRARTLTIFVALFAAALLTLPASVFAADGAWDPAVTIESTSTSIIGNPQIANDGSNLVAIWSSNTAGVTVIESSRSVDKGLTWSAPIEISSTPESAFAPKLLTDGDHFFATWGSFDSGTGIQRVLFSSSSDGGATWGTPVEVPSSGGLFTNPGMAVNNHTVTVVWSADVSPAIYIYASTSIDDGVTWGSANVIGISVPNYTQPQVVDDGDTITATWFQTNGSDNLIQVASSTDNGTTWSAPTTFIETGSSTFPTLTAGGGVTTVVWVHSDGVSNWIESASSSDQGATWNTPVNVSATDQSGYFPSAATDGNTITEIWSSNDGSINQILVSRSSNGGSIWSAPTAISNPLTSSFNAVIASHGSTLAAVWLYHDGPIQGIQAAYSLDSGATWSTPVILSSATPVSYSPQVTVSSTMMSAVWGTQSAPEFAVATSSLTFPRPAIDPGLADTGPNGMLEIVALGLALLLVGALLFAGALMRTARPLPARR